ncbi:hypothetical protein CEXT_339951 [Caerostris extrusa]|uniref:Uncharacterized protein n=1 Tax=Caerostris extrusa TaxID=172846 RepID=A0AAV4SE34_CAEEX|nr:hypothetical protein CEXT_339951 [Caerostris extrusa]
MQKHSIFISKSPCLQLLSNSLETRLQFISLDRQKEITIMFNLKKDGARGGKTDDFRKNSSRFLRQRRQEKNVKIREHDRVREKMGIFPALKPDPGGKI